MNLLMFKKLFGFKSSKDSQDSSEILKIILLALSFFFIIGAYTVAREFKDSIFAEMIGVTKESRKYYSYARILSFLFLIPVLFLHAKIVDNVKKYQLLCVYTIFFGLGGIFFAFLLGHPTIGLYNTVASPNRVLGWLFYLFVEGYSPLIVSVFWAFANSVIDPESAKNNYSKIIAASKIGGILCSGLAYIILRGNFFGNVLNIQLILGATSILLLCVPFMIYYMIKLVPKSYMHGYEAAYLISKEYKKKESDKSIKERWFTSMFSGLILLFKYPYVMGIFGLGFFFEVVNQVVKLESIVWGKASCLSGISEFTGLLLWQALIVHVLGLVIVTLGTKFLIKTLGELKALMLVPTVTGFAIFVYMFSQSYLTALFAFAVIRAVNYALAVPLRESLFIPTINEIRFKTKSWIDGMGSKFAKMSSNYFNIWLDGLAKSNLFVAQGIFFSVAISIWLGVSYALGRRFEKAVKNNEVIGS